MAVLTPAALGMDDEPTARHFRHVDVVMMRSSWNALGGILRRDSKGGDNRVNHSHLEPGSFVLDFEGQRFASDLGPDDYNLPGYFGRSAGPTID